MKHTTEFPKNWFAESTEVQKALDERRKMASKLGKNILLTIKVCDGIVNSNFKTIAKKKDK